MGIENKVFLGLMVITVISLIFSSSSAYALRLTNTSFDSDAYFQGENGVVTLTLYNDNAFFQWNIRKVEIYFDWMPSGTTYQTDVNQNIASGSSATYNIQFSIPPSVTVGSHGYTIYYLGNLNDLNPEGTSSIYIHDAYEKIFNNLMQAVTQKLNSEGQTGNYQSPEAKSDSEQARTYYEEAMSLSDQHQYRDAVDKLNSASTLLDQASAAEQSFRSNPANWTNLWITIIALIGVVISVSIIKIRQKSAYKRS